MYIEQTIQWIKSVVISLNLCPFAKREMDRKAVRIEVSSAIEFAEGINHLLTEIDFLNNNPKTSTTLLVFPHFLSNFHDYLDFVDLANETLLHSGNQGIYQLATFHPKYQFYGTGVDDVTNYTNRSPYPMLHLLREEMLDEAITYYGDTEAIPENNIQLMKKLGLAQMIHKLEQCFLV